MHKMYKAIWNVSVKLSNCVFGTKKFWCMLLNTMLWLFIGAAIYGITYSVIGFQFSFAYMSVVIGYFAMLFGYVGGIMYIVRNTEPDELK